MIIKTNDELDKLIRHRNIINYIKAQRLSWFGHLHQILEERMVKKVYKWKPMLRRPLGRPKNRWEDDLGFTQKKLKIKNWTNCIQDRKNLEIICWEGQNFQRIEVVVPEEEEYDYVIFVIWFWGSESGLCGGMLFSSVGSYRHSGGKWFLHCCRRSRDCCLVYEARKWLRTQRHTKKPKI
jgi:hypothetical protein